MKASNIIIQELSNKYNRKGMIISKAFEVWKEASLNSKQIQDQIYYDIGEKIPLNNIDILHKLTAEHVFFQTNNNVRLTPTLKHSLNKIETNRYKLAGVDIVWKIEMKNGSPWLKRVMSYNDNTEVVEEESLRQSGDTSWTKQAAVEENEPWEVYYWNSDLANRFLEEYPGSLPEELRCIFKELEGLQQGAIRESDFLLRVLDIAEEHKDLVKSLRDKADEEFEKRKTLRDKYEKGEKPEYYRGASDNSLVRPNTDGKDYVDDDELDLELLD